MNADTPALPEIGHCAGIYEIRNKVTGDAYIGASGNIAGRWRQHATSLTVGAHINRQLQAAWVEFGSDAFEWTVREIVNPRDSLWDIEDAYLTRERPAYNTKFPSTKPPKVRDEAFFRAHFPPSLRAQRRARATRALKPVVGVMHLGDCPRCGLALCLEVDETGAHLAVDEGE